ncbi:hypothetical protein LPJ61_002460 [Coemansia biformis]|uniref:Uncharacterized protein n=1 Tax=Coemansia biformis TaxID=1286918 RepID=A0A9W7YE14_9FUNG|nr:hypothetical protein LPJ61_002460 [Coemansia biformis]
MKGVWVQFSGLTPGRAVQDLQRLAGGRVGRVEFQHSSRTEVAGRLEVASVDEARRVLESANYAVVNGSVVRLSMGPEFLAGCRPVVLEGIPLREDEDTRLYEYCRRFGLVCGLQTEKGTARVWLDSEDGAQGLVNSIKTGGYYGMRPQAYIELTDPAAIVIEGEDSDSLLIDSVSRPGKALPRDGKPAAPAAAAAGLSGSARKSTGKRRRDRGRPGGRQGKVLRTGPAHIQHPASASARQSRSAPQQTGADGDGGERGGSLKHVRNIMDMTPWRAKAPFIYDFIYRRAPEATADDDGCCLSMAWGQGQQPGTLNCYLSQGNLAAASTVRDWINVGQSFDDVSSAITMTTFDIPACGHSANIKSLLSAFNSSDVSILHKNQKKDDNRQVIAALKLYDEGRILFGCTMQSVIVWSTDAIRQKEMLLLMDDIDGVYDVGRDYVVANSSRGEMGVWKAGSRNYMWRYNDTRRFRGTPLLSTDSLRITALQVAADDQGAYVGDSLGRLSYCDFRAPHIDRLTSEHRGILKCIEPVGSHGVLTGTYDGRIALLDARFIHANGQASVVRKYHSSAGSIDTVNSIRVCPHNPDIFACAIGTNVYIYAKEPQQSQSLLFSHEAHQTQVTDFCWHPDIDFMYTIGSTELGAGRGSGEIQIWRPSGNIL